MSAGRWHAPLDPSCPEVAEFLRSLEDPITRSAGIDEELTEDFDRRHRKTCGRCREYGAANISAETG